MMENATVSGNRAGEAGGEEHRDGCANWKMSLSFFFEKHEKRQRETGLLSR
jgi:hypothetical protein